MLWIFTLLVSLCVALPTELVRRQSSSTRDEFINGPCTDIIFFFVRGTSEAGNMGARVGPPLADGLESRYGADRVAVQGVAYPAGVATNLLPNEADPTGVTNFESLVNEANTRCPSSIVIASGYSQGAAVIHAAFDDGFSDSVKSQIAGVVLFGDTRKLQDHAQLTGYPSDRLLIICNDGDLVCDGTLIITSAHLNYTGRIPEAVDFFAARIAAAGYS